MPRHVFILFLAWIVPALVEVRADSWSGKSVDFSHGDLCVSPNGRFLQHTDRTPFLYLGDTAWELIYRLNEPEVELYMENRRAKGFTVIQTVILSELDGSDGINRPLINGSPSTPDPDYFKWVDRVLEIAEEKGLYVGLLPTWGDKVDKQWGAGPEIFDEVNAREYGRWLGRRYADTPNIIWIIGGDRSGEGKNFTVWKAMAEGIKECDKRHLMTYHPQGEHSSSFWFHDETWLDFNMFQSGHAQRDYAIYRRLLLNDLQKQPLKPVLDGEPRYENIPIDFKSENGRFDDFDVRVTLYQSMFSGACGYTYGCNEVWQMYSDKYSPMIDAQTTWKESLDLAGACDMIHFRKLCEAIDFFRGRPLQHLIERPEQTDDDYAVAYGGKDYVLFYMPYGHSITVNLSGRTQRKNVRLEWFNPRNGELIFYKNIETSEAFEVVSPTQGRGNDWVLIAR